ncbi:MAG: class I SAM-dependent methyltransferase [Phormidesmis sp.]
MNSTPHPTPQWTDYYQAVAGRPPLQTLLTALDRQAEETAQLPNMPKFAVDLGCGDGRDTVELLRRNWSVLAFDGEPEASARLQQRQDINRTCLTTQLQRFETLTLPESVILIKASFCLPLCPPDHFEALCNTIVSALNSGGRLCGRLFGDRDTWTTYPNRTHHTRTQIDRLLSPFKVELLDEEEHPGKTALGEEKDWHIYNIVAQKI